MNALALVAFLFSIAVQYNDPDPIRWMAIYAVAATACVLEMRRLDVWFFPIAIALIAFIWAGRIHHHLPGPINFSGMFASFKMKDEGIEQQREMFGLMIVAVWMVIISIAVGLRQRTAHLDSTPRPVDDDWGT